MLNPKLISISLLLLFSFSLPILASHDDDDLAELEELLAVDEQEDEVHASSDKPSEADLLSKAQRIVLHLTNENAQKVVDGNEYVLVLGYAPWCIRSAEIMPHFAEAATSLRMMGSSLVLAKLDAERHTKAASLLGVKGFPTLILFVNGTAHVYTGGFTTNDIVIWARKKTGAPLIRLSSTAAAEEILQKHHTLVLGLFKNFQGSDYDEFVKASISDDEIQFVETTDLKIAAVLFPDIKPEDNFIGLIKSEPEKYVAYGGLLEKSKILEFLDYNKFPLVTKLTELNSVRVYSSPIKLQVFIFAVAEDFNKLLAPFQDVSRKFVSKIMFIYVDSEEDNLAKPFFTLFGLEPERSLAIAMDNKIGSKYLLEAEPTPENLEEFCSKLLHGKLSPYYKSQPVPDNTGIVKAVVGRTFDALVLSSSDNVLLEVYTSWCITCEAMSKQMEKLAKHFKGLANLTFARIDASLNEHPRLEANDYPTILFYKSGEKSKPIKLSNKSSLKDFVSFIKAKVKNANGDTSTSTSDQTTKDEL